MPAVGDYQGNRKIIRWKAIGYRDRLGKAGVPPSWRQIMAGKMPAHRWFVPNTLMATPLPTPIVQDSQD